LGFDPEVYRISALLEAVRDRSIAKQASLNDGEFLELAVSYTK
jgi:hypothetical protein